MNLGLSVFRVFTDSAPFKSSDLSSIIDKLVNMHSGESRCVGLELA